MSRVAIVTGGTRGIGRAICEALRDQGATVVANYAGNEEKARAFTDQTGIAAYKWDVGDHEACLEGCARVSSEVGPVDVLVNNAGITRDNLIMRMDADEWDAVIDTNLSGPFWMTRAVARPMLKARSGRIINMSSAAGRMGNAGQANYAAAKAGLIGLTKSLAKEYGGKGITANAIAPGFVESDLTSGLSPEIKAAMLKSIPAGRFAKPQDVAPLASFLARDESAYVNGQVLTVDGGMVTS